MKMKTFFLILIIFWIFFGIFYKVPHFLSKIDNIFISITIFLFATLVGFFISRQTARYKEIVEKVTSFDGNMSFLFRSFIVFGENNKERLKKILVKHYKTIMLASDWNSYFNKKTSTITDINNLIIEISSNNDLNAAQSGVTSRTFFILGDLQKIRKNLIALYQEKIPRLQQLLVFGLTLILILAISSIESQGVILASLIKAAFVSSIISVVIMLEKLNKLTFFESMVGQSSAQDVLDIIKGNK